MGACTAMCAGRRVKMHAVQADAVKKTVNGTERADIFAKRPVNNEACNKTDYQDAQLQPEEKACLQTVFTAVDQHDRKSAFKSSRRTDIFAEGRCEFENDRKSDHKDQ